MPTEPLIQKIRDRIITVLKAITAGDDYFYTPFKVEEKFISHEQLKGDPTYFVFIGDAEPPEFAGVPDDYDQTFFVLVGGWVKDMSDPTKKAIRAMRDVTRAIDEDSKSASANTLGTMAHQVIPDSWDTTKGNFSILGFEWFERRFKVLVSGTFDEL